VAEDECDRARGLAFAEDGLEAGDFVLGDGEADDYFDCVFV